MNVEIKSNETGRKIMLATKDIAAGETIYKASDPFSYASPSQLLISSLIRNSP